MKFHGIEMEGEFKIQKVNSLPSYDFDRDEGRLVYNLTDKKFYYGDNAKWNKISDADTQVIAGDGLTGGGSLEENRTLDVDFGTTAGTVCQGNDSRLSDNRNPIVHDNTRHSVNYVDESDSRLSDNRNPIVHDNTRHSVNYTPESRIITAGSGLTGGGNLTSNRTINVNFGTTAGTVCQGNDSRLAYVDQLQQSYAAGNYLLTNSTVFSTNNDSWKRVWEILFVRSGTVRVKIGLMHPSHKSNSSAQGYVALNSSRVSPIYERNWNSWQYWTYDVRYNAGNKVSFYFRTSHHFYDSHGRVRIGVSLATHPSANDNYYVASGDIYTPDNVTATYAPPTI